ncbi:MAG: ATP-grasp domain-containing protein [Pseudomonadota bacterium]
MRKNVLITAIGGDIAQGIAAILRRAFPDWRLTGTDVHSRHAGSLFVDRFYEAPRASDPGYEDALKAIVKRDAIGLVIPMSEAELQLLSSRGGSEIGGAGLLMANPLAIEVGADKLKTARFLESIGVPAPWTDLAENFLPQKHLPCIFKPRQGAGSKAVFRCETVEEVEFYRHRHSDAIIQELLLPADQEVTCGVFRTGEGRIAVVQLLRTLTGGFTGWAQVIDDPEVFSQCSRLAEALNLRGSINVQLRITDGGARIFEINPRFSSTVLMRHHMGFCDLIWSIQDLMGEDVHLFSPKVGTTAVRLQGAQLLNPHTLEQA